MRKFFCGILFLLFSVSLFATDYVAKGTNYFTSLRDDQPLMQFGFKIGYNFPLNKEFAPDLHLQRSRSAEFGIFARVGKYVYGEIGFYYMFHKTTFGTQLNDSLQNSFAEFRYFQIPVKAVANFSFKEKYSIMPNVGIIYQPMFSIANSDDYYSKETITQHSCLFTAGIGFKIHFVTLDINYRHSFTNFFQNRGDFKENSINLSLGFQLR